MKKIILLLSIFIVSNCLAQNFSLIKSIPTKANKIEVDRLGNIYAIEDYSVIKYNSEGIQLNAFNETSNGMITNIDVSNPLKPIIFYSDFQILAILDNKLSLVNEIDFASKYFNQVSLINNAKGDNLWIYDEIEDKIKKLDKNLITINESENFYNLFDNTIKVIDIVENENELYVLTKQGVKVFDNYANYKKTIYIEGIKNFQLIQNKLFYIKGNKLISYNLKTFEEQEIKLFDTKEIKQVKLIKNKTISITKNKILIHQINVNN